MTFRQLCLFAGAAFVFSAGYLLLAWAATVPLAGLAGWLR